MMDLSRKTLLLTIIACIHIQSSLSGVVLESCRSALGLQDGSLPDSAFSASSQHHTTTSAKYARLNNDDPKTSGAWCPKGNIIPDNFDQYLQVDLPIPYFLTIVAMQGRYANGAGEEFTPFFYFNYTRDGETWKQWSKIGGTQLFTGNVDTNTVKKVALRRQSGIPGVRAIRVIPVTQRDQPVCLRLELYGCEWTSGLFSYSMPAPQWPPSGLAKYEDESFDGVKSTSAWSDGLGQLSDRVIGLDDMSKTVMNPGNKIYGFDYVGWYQQNTTQFKVPITFQFFDMRNFTSMRIHARSEPEVHAKIFRAIDVAFSMNGVDFPDSYFESVGFKIPSVDGAQGRWVSVPLNHTVARAMRVTLHASSPQLLISEITFQNELLKLDEEIEETSTAAPMSPINIPPVTEPETTPPTVVTSASIATEENNVAGGNEGLAFWQTTEPAVVSTVPVPASLDIGLIVGILVAVIVVLLLLVLILYCRYRKVQKNSAPPRYNYQGGTTLINDQMVTLQPLMPTTSDGQAGPLPNKHVVPIYQEIGPNGMPSTSVNDNVYLEPIGMKYPPPYNEYHETAKRSNRKIL